MEQSDKQLQKDLIYGERIIPRHPKYGRVRLRRPSPLEETLISEERSKRYHAAMRDDNALSKAQLLKIAEARGMWSSEKEAKLNEGTTKIGQCMGLLEAAGFKDLPDVLTKYTEERAKIAALLTDQPEALDILDEYTDLTKTPTLAQQHQLIEATGTSSEQFEEIATLRTQIELFEELVNARKEVDKLREEHVSIFQGSIESQADRAEEMAHLYYCARNADDDSQLWPSYEAAWNSRSEDIEELIIQMQYFRHGITPEYEKALGRFGFTRRLSDTEEESEDSPAQPSANSDGESQESEQTSSSQDTVEPTEPSTPA